jgi:hypothetical protein
MTIREKSFECSPSIRKTPIRAAALSSGGREDRHHSRLCGAGSIMALQSGLDHMARIVKVLSEMVGVRTYERAFVSWLSGWRDAGLESFQQEHHAGDGGCRGADISRRLS